MEAQGPQEVSGGLRIAGHGSAEACQLIFGSTSEMIALFLVGAHGELIVEAVNSAFLTELERYGVSVPLERILGSDVRSALTEIGEPPDLVDSYTNSYESAVLSKSRLRLEHELQTPGGTLVLEEDILPILNDEGNRTTHMLWTRRNITERRRMEQALRESEERYRHIFENSTDLLFLLEVTPEGRFLNREINPALERSTGIPRNQLIGRHTDEAVPPETAEIVNKKYRQAVETGRIVDEVVSLDMPTGTRTYHSTIIPTRDEAGRVTRLVGISRDITDQIRMQDEIQLGARTVREKDMAIRQAYVDVIAAVTGDKLVLMTGEELNESLGRPVMDAQEVCDVSGLAGARHAIARAWKENAPDAGDPAEFMTAVGEALANAVVHAGCGEYRVWVHDSTVQIEVRDDGPGIDFAHLPKATLLSGYSTKQTLGMGFTLMLEESDQLLLSTGHEGTRIVLEFGRDVTPYR